MSLLNRLAHIPAYQWPDVTKRMATTAMATETETRERPIPFSSEMVRAILEDRKTMTRRVVKPQPFTGTLAPGERWVTDEEYRINAREGRFPCPYGRPGDVLYVRETWRPADWAADGGWGHIEYRDGGLQYVEGPWSFDKMLPMKQDPRRWRPSIHMPKWASRIRLRITDVRVERVQDITAEDAIAEGIIDDAPNEEYWGIPLPVVAFSELWESINGKRAGCSWVDNPFVWVISFERA